jgi:translocation and assembly module TamA
LKPVTPSAVTYLRLLCQVISVTLLSTAALAEIDIRVAGVDGEAADNLAATLSLYRYRDQGLDDLALQRLIQRVPSETEKALRPFGYYQTATEVVADGSSGQTKINIKVEPGPRSVWRTIVVAVRGAGSETAAIQRVLSKSPLVPGEAVDHRNYDTLKATLEATAISTGFLDWRWDTHRLEVHPTVNKADVLLIMETGPRYRFGAVSFHQQAVDHDVAQRLIQFESGDDYDEQALLNTQYALLDSQYYSVARVSPTDRDPVTKTVPVNIETTPQKRQRITFGIGYGSDTRLRGSTGWRWQRLNGRGHRAQIRYAGAATRNELGLRYEIPGKDPISEQLRFYGSFIDEELADTDSRRITAGVGRTRKLRQWQMRNYVELLREETTLPGMEPTRDLLFMPGVSLDRWVRDRTINPDHGYRLTADLRGSQQSLLSDTNFLRLVLNAKWLASFRDNYQLLVRGQFGTAWVESFAALPASQRFFAGGDQSIRGFGFNELSPRNAQGEIIGGQHLVFGSVELARRIRGPWRLAVFADGGGALSNLNDELEYSVGVGVRWETPVGKIRLDIAKPVTLGDRSPRIHIGIQPSL